MNTPTNKSPTKSSMNTQELIELAVLDAMGLLDEQERDAFDAAFDAAAPAIQAQVRREQTRLSLSDHLLPDVEPPAGLRALVLEAVRKAMALPAASRHRRLRTLAIGLTPSRQVSPIWRAASVGFAAAAVTFGLTFMHNLGEFDRLARAVESDRLLSDIQGAVGSPYVVSLLTDPRTEAHTFSAMPGVTRGEARLWLNPTWGEGEGVLLAMSNLPTVENNTIYVCTYAGGSLGEPVHEFQAQAGVQMVSFRSPQARTTRLALAARDTDGALRPLFVMPATSGLAWSGPTDARIVES